MTFHDPRGAAGFIDFIELGRTEPPPLIEKIRRRPIRRTLEKDLFMDSPIEKKPSPKALHRNSFMIPAPIVEEEYSSRCC